MAEPDDLKPCVLRSLRSAGRKLDLFGSQTLVGQPGNLPRGVLPFPLRWVGPNRAVKVIEWWRGIRPIEDLSPACEIC